MTNQVDVGSLAAGVWSGWHSSDAIVVTANTEATHTLTFDLIGDSVFLAADYESAFTI